MSAQLLEHCQYCGHPLRLAGGFCAACHAPAAVAQRARLVAVARRQTGLAIITPAEIGRSSAAVALADARRSTPRWLWPLALVGLAALLLASLNIGARLSGNTASLAFAPIAVTLSASATPGGDPATVFRVGQPLTLTYRVQIDGASGDVALVVTPDQGRPATLVERRAPGDARRSVTLIPAVAGHWLITLALDHRQLASLTLTIVGNG